MKPTSLKASANVAQSKLPARLTAGMLAAALSPALTYAAGTTADSAELETVSVTAEQPLRGSYKTETSNIGKQKQALKDIPQAITVVNRQLLDDQLASNLKDALKNVSGITFAAGEGGRSGDQVYLRGFAAFQDTYRDGQRDVAQYNRDPFNDEKIEVLKGASSMLFGRGSTGGVVNQVSKTPFAGERLEGSLSVGTDDFQRMTLDINQAFSDTAAARLNLMATNDGTPNGIEVAKRWGVAPSLAFGLGEPTTLTLSHLHLTENNTPMLGVPYDPNTHRPIDVPADRYYGLQGMNSEDIQTDISTVRLSHKLAEDHELSSQLRVGRYDRWLTVAQPQLRNDSNSGGVSAGTPVTDATLLRYSGKNRGSLTEVQAWSNDYTSRFDTGGLRHNLLAGVEFTHETQDAFSIVASQNIANLLTTVGDPSAVSYTGSYSTSPSNSYVTRNWALYATDTVELTPQWKFMAGLRQDRLEGSYKAYSNGSVSRESVRDDKGMSYRTGLIWQPSTSQSYYAGYSNLMNPSGEAYQFDVTSGASADRLKPERNEHYEIGAKWDLLDGDASFRTALFRTIKYNERNTDALSPDISILYAKRHTDGIEFEVAGRLSENWSVFAGAALLDPVIDQGWNNTTQSASDANAGAVPKYTPKRTANLWTTYKLSDTVTAGFGAYYTGKRYSSDSSKDQSTANYLPGFIRYDAMLAYETRKYKVQLNLNNLTDKKYYIGQYTGHAYAGNQREAQLTIGYKY